MSGISTHVLDLTRGRPAGGVEVRLWKEAESEWVEIACHKTDVDGRVKHILPENEEPDRGRYRLHFETAEYFQAQGVEPFHPFVEIAFEVHHSGENYHIPLLLTAHSYSTYRGS